MRGRGAAPSGNVGVCCALRGMSLLSASGLAGTGRSSRATRDPVNASGRGTTLGIVELTHLDETGAARMVDVSAKDVTVRTAHAQGRFVTTPEVIDLLRRDGLPKGDALAVARIA